MKILITGHTGYIGRSLTTYLTGVCGHTVIGVSRKGPSTKHQVVESITWDELDALQGIDCIIHLAGMAREEHSRSHENDYFRINTELTQTIYDFFLRSAANTFIYFSSIKAAAEVCNIPLSEEETPHPESAYGRSKQEAEAYILSHMPGEKTPNGDPGVPDFPVNRRNIYILRPCMIHGPGRHGNLRSLFDFIRKGFPWPFYDLDNHRSYLSMDNLNYIIDELLNPIQETPSRRHDNSSLVTRHSSLVTRHSSLVICPSGIYHLCDDSPLSTTRIIEMTGEVLGKRPARLRLPAWFIHFAANTGTALHLPFNRMTVKKMTGNLIVSNNKIKRALNISALPVTAEEGMYKTIKSF